MTKINSNAIGDATKSMGEITYRRLGSIVVGTKRIRTNKSRSPAQLEQRKAFGLVGRLSRTLKPLIMESFEATEGLSEMNLFVKENLAYQRFVRKHVKHDTLIPPIKYLADILGNPAFEDRVVAGKGTDIVQQSLSWGAAADVNVSMGLSRKFAEGDTVVIGVGYAFSKGNKMLEQLRLFYKTLTKEDVEQLEYKNEFTANRTTMPDFDVMRHIPAKASAVQLVITAMVHRRKAGKKRCSMSVFSLMPAGG